MIKKKKKSKRNYHVTLPTWMPPTYPNLQQICLKYNSYIENMSKIFYTKLWFYAKGKRK